MKTITRFIAATLMLALFIGTSVTHAKTYKVKLGHSGSSDPASTWMVGSNFLKQYLEAKSQGRLKVTVYPSGQLGNMRAMLEQTQMGNLELTFNTLNGFAYFMPQIVVLGAPYIFPSDEVIEEVYKGWFVDDLRQELLKRTRNIRLLGIGNLGRWRSFQTTKKQIKSAADLKGVKIRTIPDPMQIQMVKTLGGNPTPLPWPEVYTSLAAGVIDGVKLEVYILGLYKLDEFAKYAVMDEHSYMWSTFAASDKWLKSLPPDLQQIVVDGVKMTINVVTEYAKVSEMSAHAAYEKKGGTIHFPSPAEKASFMAARIPMQKWFRENVEDGGIWLDKLNRAIKEAEATVANRRANVLK